MHEASGRAMYDLCIDLRGFYLKVWSRCVCVGVCLPRSSVHRVLKHLSLSLSVSLSPFSLSLVAPCCPSFSHPQAGQFIGSRSDFVPEQICRHLALLCDRVRGVMETSRGDVQLLFEMCILKHTCPLGGCSDQVNTAAKRIEQLNENDTQHLCVCAGTPHAPSGSACCHLKRAACERSGRRV